MDEKPNSQQANRSSSYTLAFEDAEFLKWDELRPVRLQLELLKPELVMKKEKIRSTVVVFGSARTLSRKAAEETLAELERRAQKDPHDAGWKEALTKARAAVDHSRYYEQAREFARLVSRTCQRDEECNFVMVTGGGPGIMEAANRGASEAGAKSIGLNSILPHEQAPNPYISPELCFHFQYFALRKMHFLLRAKALVALPGGFGTLDELFETLTLIQTGKTKVIPVLLFGKRFWQRLINFEFLVEQGTISAEDLKLFDYVDTAAEAWQKIKDFHGWDR